MKDFQIDENGFVCVFSISQVWEEAKNHILSRTREPGDEIRRYCRRQGLESEFQLSLLCDAADDLCRETWWHGRFRSETVHSYRLLRSTS